LARGEVTSGAVKILGIGATGLGAAALVSRGPADTLINGAAIAGAANLANLFDLRPGRAIKVGLLTGGPLLAAAVAGDSPATAALTAVPLGAPAALLPGALGERGTPVLGVDVRSRPARQASAARHRGRAHRRRGDAQLHQGHRGHQGAQPDRHAGPPPRRRVTR